MLPLLRPHVEVAGALPALAGGDLDVPEDEPDLARRRARGRAGARFPAGPTRAAMK